MKFLADGMLGSLSRWLRMLGQDVTYSVNLNDSDLLELAKKQERILLTRDFELYKRAINRSLEAFYVEGKSESDRLAVVAERYKLELNINMNRSRCPKCNTPLKAAPKEQLQEKLEKNTFTYYNEFWMCPNCRQIYWQGAHWKQITKTLTEAKMQLQELKEKSESSR